MMKQGYRAVFSWHKHSAKGRDSLEDDEHTSRPEMVRPEIKDMWGASLCDTPPTLIILHVKSGRALY
jgi:hypothetical protein